MPEYNSQEEAAKRRQKQNIIINIVCAVVALLSTFVVLDFVQEARERHKEEQEKDKKRKEEIERLDRMERLAKIEQQTEMERLVEEQYQHRIWIAANQDKIEDWKKRNPKLANLITNIPELTFLLVHFSDLGMLLHHAPELAYLPAESWYLHQSTIILDMTTDYWGNLSVQRQSQYAEKYQVAYAKMKGLPLEKTIPLPGLPSSAIPITMRLIPPGRFWMGQLSIEYSRPLDELPRYRVVIPSSFYLAKYECTQGQWQAVMGDNPSKFADVGPDAPVENVSWDDIADGSSSFCGKTNLELPDEAEWEYASRAGTTTTYYNGEARDLRSIAWCSSFAGNQTHPVGQKLPNGFGLHDTLGNVMEWCQEWEYTSSAPGNLSNPMGPSGRASSILRGGSWGLGEPNCRAVERYRYAPSTRFSNNGFRAAKHE